MRRVLSIGGSYDFDGKKLCNTRREEVREKGASIARGI